MIPLNRVGEIWGEAQADPENFREKDTLVAKFTLVPMRKDSIMFRRSNEVMQPGANAGSTRATIYIQDSRLHYPTTFNETMLIKLDGITWEITTIHEADDFAEVHHFEVEVVMGRNR